MQEDDLQAQRTAVAALEHPGLAARLAEIAGKPIELVGRALPETASRALAAATTKALDAALSAAFRTMKNEPKAASSVLHKALAATSGAVGGSFGVAALPIELPISTIIMLRSIGDVARSEGEDLTDPETALNCLQVFALGGLKGGADAANSGYFAVRGLLAKSVAEAARFVVDRGVLAEGAPVLVRLIAQIASRFGVVVTQKLAAQAVPLVGALGGAAVNYAFVDHFQEMARAISSYVGWNGATAKMLCAQLIIGFLTRNLRLPESSGRRRDSRVGSFDRRSDQHNCGRSPSYKATTNRIRRAPGRSLSVAATLSLYPVNYANGRSQHNFP